MSIRRPIPQHPREEGISSNFDKWYHLISNHSIHILDFDVTFNPASIAASTTAEQDVTITGLGVSDIPLAFIKPSHTAGVTIGNIRVKAADTLSVQFVNATAGAVDPPSETYKLVVIRQ